MIKPALIPRGPSRVHTAPAPTLTLQSRRAISRGLMNMAGHVAARATAQKSSAMDGASPGQRVAVDRVKQETTRRGAGAGELRTEPFQVGDIPGTIDADHGVKNCLSIIGQSSPTADINRCANLSRGNGTRAAQRVQPPGSSRDICAARRQCSAMKPPAHQGPAPLFPFQSILAVEPFQPPRH